MSEPKLRDNINDKDEIIKATSRTENASELTKGNKSMSASTELLAEFLSLIMVKDYEKALECCTQILKYEPSNETAKEFYPLIVQKLEFMRNEETDNDSLSDSSDSFNSSSSLSDDSSYKENEITSSKDSDGTTESCYDLEDEKRYSKSDDTNLKNGNNETYKEIVWPVSSQENERKREIMHKISSGSRETMIKRGNLQNFSKNLIPSVSPKTIKNSSAKFGRNNSYSRTHETNAKASTASHQSQKHTESLDD